LSFGHRLHGAAQRAGGDCEKKRCQSHGKAFDKCRRTGYGHGRQARRAVTMFYRHRIDHCFEDRIGKNGLVPARLGALLKTLAPGVEELNQRRNAAAAPLLAVPSMSDDLAAITARAKKIQAQFSRAVVVGAGGSSLSGRALAMLKPSPHLHFLETIDPDAIA